jgi:hypothetical protein
VLAAADPSITEQIGAVLSAPIPFFLALFGVLVPSIYGIWSAFDWRYGGVIERYKTVLELVAKEAEVAKQKQEELQEAMRSLKGDVEKVRAGKRDESEKDLAKILESLSKVEIQTRELGEANAAVSHTISDAPFART